MIKEWNQKKVIAAISGRVVQNMDRACQFAEEQAWAKAPVRRGILRALTRHDVKARGDVVEGRVGVLRKAFWGWFQEMGTAKMPATPFLRPAVFGNAKRIVQIIRGEK